MRSYNKLKALWDSLLYYLFIFETFLIALQTEVGRLFLRFSVLLLLTKGKSAEVEVEEDKVELYISRVRI